MAWGRSAGIRRIFFDGLAALTEPLQLIGAGAAFADTGRIAMNAEEMDRTGEGLNSTGHGAEVRGTPPQGVHGSILAG